jgi:hypothetical protein
MATTALAHITPPVVLMSDRDALLGLLAGAKRFFVREVRLSPDERTALQRQSGWTPDEEFYRFYIGRDDAGQVVAAAVFITDFTIHGPVRVAVALGPDARVRGARIVEVTEETYPWVKPLADHDFAREYVGRDSRASFALSERLAKGAAGEMSRFYGQILVTLVQRGAALYEVGVLRRGPGA